MELFIESQDGTSLAARIKRLERDYLRLIQSQPQNKDLLLSSMRRAVNTIVDNCVVCLKTEKGIQVS